MTAQEKLTKEECAQLIKDIKDPIVVMHARPDGDTVGTAAALLRVLEMLGKKGRYACQDPVPDRLAFIIEGFEAAEPPYEGGIVSVDVASPSQLGELKDQLTVDFMIDHHRVSSPFAPIYSVPTASSAAEVLYDVIEVLIKSGDITLTDRLAAVLYAGISSDTGCFCYSNTTAATYRLAALLVETGIDHAEINHRLFNSKAPEQLAAEGITASTVRLEDEGKIGYAVITKAMRDEAGIAPQHFETAIDIVRSVRGVEVAFAVKENDKGEYKVSLRSTGRNVAEIAQGFGGGGHIRAAGCSVQAKDAYEAAELVLHALGHQSAKAE